MAIESVAVYHSTPIGGEGDILAAISAAVDAAHRLNAPAILEVGEQLIKVLPEASSMDVLRLVARTTERAA